jgi:hypothetical protein
MGKIRLSMRSPNDDAKLETEGAMQSNLLGDNRNTNSRDEESSYLKSEDRPKPETSGNPLLSLLEKMKGPSSPHTTVEVEKPAFRMTIIRGPDIEELEVDGSGKMASSNKSAAAQPPVLPGLPPLPGLPETVQSNRESSNDPESN